jgi:2-isopropylmalate synthase
VNIGHEDAIADIYDWNAAAGDPPTIAQGFELVDETLRDGIQSPSVRNPSIDEKLELLHLMEACGIDVADVGLPGTGEVAVQHVTRLCEEIRDQGLHIAPNCAARTHPADIEPIIAIADTTGVQIEVCAFIGASPIRRLLEGWDLPGMQRKVERAATLTVDAGLPFSFVTEDTTRTDPETLEALFRTAISHGASRLILTDTVGHATPDGVANLVAFTRGIVASTGAEVALDWHGHDDRALATTLALRALENGVDRIHGTCMGVGERVGNAAIDKILVNLKLLGIINRDLSPLRGYVERVSTYYGVPIPTSYPVFGRDAFRTATGVHASAIVKALERGRRDFADRVYSSVPAADFGCEQIIEVGFCSGQTNVRHWLRSRGLEATDKRTQVVLTLAKSRERVLEADEIVACLVDGGLLSPAEAADLSVT